MSKAKYREVRKAKGVCDNCGTRPRKKGCTWCVVCLRLKTLTQLDRYAERIERGVCWTCGEKERDQPLTPGVRKRCPKCRRKTREATRRWREKQKIADSLSDMYERSKPKSDVTWT